MIWLWLLQASKKLTREEGEVQGTEATPSSATGDTGSSAGRQPRPEARTRVPRMRWSRGTTPAHRCPRYTEEQPV